MLYFFIRPFARLGLLLFCRKIYIYNAEVLKKDRPIILASNHPTAFLEPCILACFLASPIHYVVRADFFKTPFISKIMHSLHLIPIYRKTNAQYSDLKQNFELIAGMQHHLNKNNVLMVLVEGSASIKKHLRPIQKGVARIAFGTYENFNRDDIEIIPVGVNFDYPTQFRLTTMIGLGEPLLLKHYMATYKNNKAKAINELIKDIRRNIQNNMIHLNDIEQDETLLEQWLVIHRNEHPCPRFPIFSRDAEVLQSEQKIANRINELTTEEKMEIKEKTEHYFSQLQKKHLLDIALKRDASTYKIILFLLGLPFFIIGYLLNALPFWVGKKIATQKAKKIQYFIPIMWAIWNITYLFYFFILLFLACLMKNWIAISMILVMPLLVYFSVIFAEEWQEWKAIRKKYRLTDSEIMALKTQRNIILSYFRHLN